jgi:hypothetical protein
VDCVNSPAKKKNVKNIITISLLFLCQAENKILINFFFHKINLNVRFVSVTEVEEGYCEKLTPDQCPSSAKLVKERAQIEDSVKLDEYVHVIVNEAVKKMDLIITLGLTGLTLLVLILGHYCINRGKKEGPLVGKLNELERHLMVCNKENQALKTELIDTKHKLASIEDNSFGSNDMVIALKRELEMSEQEKMELREQILSLEKELETAAEAGLELNKMVTELLNNQSGSDSIISSVEELQKQLNEQQGKWTLLVFRFF